MQRDDSADPPRLVCTVGTTTLYYDVRCLDDLQAMLRSAADWVPLGSADEQKVAVSPVPYPLKSKSLTWHWEFMFTRPMHEPDSTYQHELLERVS
jgi:hypothetical protein